MNKEGFTFNNREEFESMKPLLIVEKITDGLEFGHGTISGDIDKELYKKVDDIVHSQDILVKVDKYDDGCGDGRGVSKIFKGGEEVETPNLHRPKVFGGSLAMAVSTRIGLGVTSEKDPVDEFAATVRELAQKDIKFGAHTDNHAHGKNCGCGAIDRFPEIVQAAVRYEEEIREVINILGMGTEGEDEDLENVFRGFFAVRAWSDEDVDYAGSEVMGTVNSETNAVVKELDGAHKEVAIVLNGVKDYTVNQSLIREKTNDEAQIFAVDVWRLADLAGRLYAGEDVSTQRKALLSEVVYTLATAAVLTKGDLPVYLVTDAKAAELAKTEA